ncbi:hypothetical protein [Acinetobacter guillouiae]|uniref:hypothetical protein n=1 Tax=Acinetobacter guillouiae TaxID=106649 RepID=UPI001250196D|nr:hypothetical protein [Acinetobacter guillouiae]
MEFLTNPSWWMQLVIQAVVGAGLIVIIKRMYSFTSSRVTNPFKKKGFIGKFVRKLNLKQLLKVRSIINDEVKINREIIKQYTYLSIFFMTIVIYLCTYIILIMLFNNLSGIANKNPLKFNIIFLIVTSPIYIFEVLYLNQKGFVDKIFKYRK